MGKHRRACYTVLTTRKPNTSAGRIAGGAGRPMGRNKIILLRMEEMRCMCQNCGEYMVHHEMGVVSHCVCPNCLARCDACLGTRQEPLPPEALGALLRERAQGDAAGQAPEQRVASRDADRW